MWHYFRNQPYNSFGKPCMRLVRITELVTAICFQSVSYRDVLRCSIVAKFRALAQISGVDALDRGVDIAPSKLLTIWLCSGSVVSSGWEQVHG